MGEHTSASFRDMMSSRGAQKEYGVPSSFCKSGNLLVRGDDGSIHKTAFKESPTFEKAAQDIPVEEFTEKIMPETSKHIRMNEPGGVKFSVESRFKEQGLPLDQLDKDEMLKGYYDTLSDAYMNGGNDFIYNAMTFADFVASKKAEKLRRKKMGIDKGPYRITDD